MQSSSAAAVVKLDDSAEFPPGNHRAVGQTGISHLHTFSCLTLMAADATFGCGLLIPIKLLHLLHFLSLTPQFPLILGLDEAAE